MSVPVHDFDAWQVGLDNRMGSKESYFPLDSSSNEKFYAVGDKKDFEDELRGGEGDDEYITNVAGVLVIDKGSEGIAIVSTSLPVFILPENVENLTLTSGKSSLKRRAGTANHYSNDGLRVSVHNRTRTEP